MKKEKLTKKQLYSKEYYQKNKIKIKATSRKNYNLNRDSRRARAKVLRNSPENYRQLFLDRARGRSRRSGLKFNLTVEDIIIPKRCPVFNCLLKRNKDAKSPAFNSPSIDKIIPKKGYIKGNVQVISYKANVMKNNATIKELIQFAEWILKTYKK